LSELFWLKLFKVIVSLTGTNEHYGFLSYVDLKKKEKGEVGRVFDVYS